MMSDNTSRGYLLAAYAAAKHSPDPSTQNGAVLVPSKYDEHAPFIIGYNKFPNGVAVEPNRLVKPIKYSFMEHAERYVIYRAACMGVSTCGATLYVPWFACVDCARAIIISGISKVVGHKQAMERDSCFWRESINTAMDMLHEAKIDIELYDGQLGCDEVLFSGKMWQP